MLKKSFNIRLYLLQLSELLDRILNMANSGFAIHDHEEKIFYLSENYLRTHNITEERWKPLSGCNAPISGAIPVEYRLKIIEAGGLYLVARVKREKRSISSIVQLPNGCHYIANVIPILDDHKNVQYIFTIINDLSEISQMHRESIPLPVYWSRNRSSSPSRSPRNEEAGQCRTSTKDIHDKGYRRVDLITGESARKDRGCNYIHSKSRRAQKPLIHVNCSQSRERLWKASCSDIRRRLYGSRKRRQKGADRSRARGQSFTWMKSGTCFTMQSKILVFLQDTLLLQNRQHLTNYVDAR